MAATVPNGSVDTIKITNKGISVRKWIRDSWARKKIVALQQAVSSIVVPTRTSQLTNDSGYITQADVPPGSTASSTTPLMDGTAAVGTENAFARGDHRHPSDTNKADKATTLAGYGITDAYTKTQVDGMIPTVPTSVSAFTNDAGYITASAVPDASTATPAMDGTGAAGSSADYARADHVHPSDAAKQDVLTTAQLEAVNSGITAAKVAGYDGIVTMFGLPITITSGADLNDFMTPGHYSANTGAVAGSLTNCPTSVNFSLFVIYRTNTPLVSQIIIASTNAIYARYKSSTTWSSWYRFTGTAV